MHYRKYILHEDYFKTWSSNMAYILGFVMADGCVIHKDFCKTAKGYNLAIQLHTKDREVLEFICSEMSPNHKIRDTLYKRASGKVRHESILCLNSKILIDDVMKLGVIPNKTGKESVSEHTPEEYLRDFIRGYFDGDGCIMYKKYKTDGKFYDWWSFDINCLNKSFLESILKIFNEKLNLLGDNKIAQISKNEVCGRLRIRKKQDIYKILNWLFYDKNIYSLGRKRQLAYNIIGDYDAKFS